MRQKLYVLCAVLFFIGVILSINTEKVEAKEFYNTGCIPHLEDEKLQKSISQIQSLLTVIYGNNCEKTTKESEDLIINPKYKILMVSTPNYLILGGIIAPDSSFSLSLVLKDTKQNKGLTKHLTIVFLNTSKKTSRQASLTFKSYKKEKYNLSISDSTNMMIEIGDYLEEYQEHNI